MAWVVLVEQMEIPITVTILPPVVVLRTVGDRLSHPEVVEEDSVGSEGRVLRPMLHTTKERVMWTSRVFP